MSDALSIDGQSFGGSQSPVTDGADARLARPPEPASTPAEGHPSDGETGEFVHPEGVPSVAAAPVAPTVAAPHPELPPATFHRTAICLIALVLSLFALRVGAAFFIPLLISLFIKYALEPVVERLARIRIPRAIGAAFAVTLAIALVGGALYRFGDDFSAILDELPAATQRVRLAITASHAQHPGALAQVERAANELQKLADAAAPAPPVVHVAAAPAAAPFDVRTLLMVGSGGLFAALAQILSALFLTYFLLAAGPLLRRKLVKMVEPTMGARRMVVTIVDEIDHLNQHYFAVVVIINVAVGLFTGLCLYALGMEHALAWGIAAAILHIIPYLGSAVVSAAAALIAFGKFGTLNMALLAAGAPLLMAGVLGIGLQTWLMGRASRMNAPAVFISLLFWGMLWGAWGLLLAVPIMVAIKTICDRIEGLKSVGTLLAP